MKLIKEYEKIKKYDDFFNKHKKKDDLADCFLQGLWYIDTINAKITKIKVNKINNNASYLKLNVLFKT